MPFKFRTHTRKLWLSYVLVWLAPLLMSACSVRPIVPSCPKPVVPADLMQPIPEQGHYRKRLDQILAPNSTSSPTKPTASLSSSEPSAIF